MRSLIWERGVGKTKWGGCRYIGMNRLLMLAVPALIGLAFISPQASAWDVNQKYTGPKTPTSDTSWHPDILEGYEARYVDQGNAFDGPCRSTIIRKRAAAQSRKGYLYIHGFNDYFFQAEMGQRLVDSGYHFYAVDLRRYGRSRQPWQYPFNIRDYHRYYDDIDSAVAQMRRDGIADITLSGHSTGGLIVTAYAIDKSDSADIERVVTDSPFYGWNFNATYRNFIIPAVRNISALFKNIKIPQGDCDGYAYSLLKQFDGEWTYDTDWKMIYSPPVTSSWVGQIQSAHNNVKKHGDRLRVPLLVMHSSRKVDGCNYTPEFRYGDAVLDPEHIVAVATKLKDKSPRPVEICTIDSGLHDLILSLRPHRDAAYDSIFSFMRRYASR